MSTMTIHALDPAVEKEIRARARREGRSLNQTLKELLAAGAGFRESSAPNHKDDFVAFCGIWTDEDEKEFIAATADLETVDRRDWE